MILILLAITNLFGLDVIDKTNIQRYVSLSTQEIASLPKPQQKIYKNKVEPNILKNIKKLKFTFVPGSQHSRPIYLTITDSLHNNEQVGPKIGLLVASLKNNHWSIDSFTPVHIPHIACSDKKCSLWDKHIDIISLKGDLPPIVLIRYRTLSPGAHPLFVHYLLQWNNGAREFQLSAPIVSHIPLKADHDASETATPAPSAVDQGDDLLSFMTLPDAKPETPPHLQNSLALSELL